MDKIDKDVLLEFSSEFYNDELKKYSSAIFDEIDLLKLDDESRATAFLMNTNAENPETAAKISEKFGKKVIENVRLLHRISKVKFPETKKNIGGLRKHFLELSEDIPIIFIKLAERLTALKFAEKENSSELIRLSEEALYFYSPIAQQLGIRKYYTEMEDIAFKYLFPKDFKYLNNVIEKNRNVYNTKLNLIRGELEKHLTKHKIKARYQARVKRPYSIYRKLKKRNLTIDEIYDLLAVRIITDSTDKCYLALGVVHSNWVPIEGRFRDWITFPKSNGYRSIQTTVHSRRGDKFEIQIRTEEMHHEAEYGQSAHWSYKQGSSTQRFDWVNKLREFLDNDEYFDNPYEVFDKLKSEMKRDYINVLTPKGEIRSLPEGATPIDYAFSVHTDLGYKTNGARVNGKFAKLTTELKSGDVIEIISSNNTTPSRDWLGIVRTNRARSKILRWFKKHERDLFVYDGRNSWDRLKDKYRKKLRGKDDEAEFRRNIHKLGFKDQEEFYYSIATGGVKCSLFLLKKIYPDAFKKTERDLEKATRGRTEASQPKIKIEGLENIQTKLAKCCNPIKGEPVIAYITKKSEIKIHSKRCPVVNTGSIDPENLKTAEWESGESTQSVKIRIFGENFSDMLTLCVDEAKESKVKIINTGKVPSRAPNEGLELEIEVRDVGHLNKFKGKLKSFRAVDSIKQA